MDKGDSSAEVATRQNGAPPAAEVETDIEVVRALVRLRDQRLPLRITAEESGISRNSLQKFMRGSMPRDETRARLLRWYNSLTPEQRAGVGLPAPKPAVLDDDGEPDVDFVRQLVAQAIQRTSAWWVADSTGLSHTAVREFAEGSTPMTRTWEKLLAWYRVQKAAGLAVVHPQLSKEIRFQPTGDTADRAALGILMEAFPSRERRGVRHQVLRVLADAHQAAGREVPGWVQHLLNQRPNP